MSLLTGEAWMGNASFRVWVSVWVKIQGVVTHETATPFAFSLIAVPASYHEKGLRKPECYHVSNRLHIPLQLIYSDEQLPVESQ